MKTKAMLYISIPNLQLLRTAVSLAYQYNCAFLKSFPDIAKHNPIKHCRYRQEDTSNGYEFIRTIDLVLSEGYGDCEDLACAFAAYETANGRHCEPLIVEYQFPDGGKILHVICKYSNGSEFDPSLACGMPMTKGVKRIS